MLANCFPRVELTLHQRSHLLLRQRRPCVSLPPSSVHRADRPSVGALGFGLLVDIIGRKWAFNLTCLITSIFGMLLVRLQALLSPLNLSNTTQAAPKYNYAAICGIYFLSSIGLGGNIPIDATICLEFLPMRRRNLVALVSLWQPVGVVFASGLAYGTAARYRCDVKLPSCHAPGVASGAACCTVASNMGWRYEFIVLGAITLLIFFLRYFVFHFHESPKFLLAKGREQEAIDVLHRIAKFNKAPPPLLTVEHFAEIDSSASQYSASDAPTATAKHVIRNFFASFKHLKGLFLHKLQLFIFILLALAYMVCLPFFQLDPC